MALRRDIIQKNKYNSPVGVYKLLVSYLSYNPWSRCPCEEVTSALRCKPSSLLLKSTIQARGRNSTLRNPTSSVSIFHFHCADISVLQPGLTVSSHITALHPHSYIPPSPLSTSPFIWSYVPQYMPLIILWLNVSPYTSYDASYSA